MKYGINTLDDFDFKSKKVLARFDLNSPYNRENNTFKSTKRIEAAIPTIKELIEKKARLVLLSHQGGDLEYHNFISTRLHSEIISDLIGKKVRFLDDVCGPAARQAIEDLEESEVLLLDNVRYMAEEMTLFETKLKLNARQQAKTYTVTKLAPHGDIYVCDAFAAAHRDQPTLVGFEELLPSCMGRLFEKEYEILSRIMTSPDKPAIFILGGAKIEDAFNMMPEVLSRGITDEILVGGLLAHVFCMAGDISLGEETEKIIYAKKLDEYIDDAKKIYGEYGDKIVMPVDYAYLDSDGKRTEISAEDLPSGSAIEDIGSETIDLYKKKIDSSKTVFINGPAGVFENKETEPGTKELFTHIAESDAFSVIGGGDSISAVGKYGLAEGFSYMCTGGGAMVRFLSGEELPVVAALKRSAERFK